MNDKSLYVYREDALALAFIPFYLNLHWIFFPIHFIFWIFIILFLDVPEIASIVRDFKERFGFLEKIKLFFSLRIQIIFNLNLIAFIYLLTSFLDMLNTIPVTFVEIGTYICYGITLYSYVLLILLWAHILDVAQDYTNQSLSKWKKAWWFLASIFFTILAILGIVAQLMGTYLGAGTNSLVFFIVFILLFASLFVISLVSTITSVRMFILYQAENFRAENVQELPKIIFKLKVCKMLLKF